MLQHLKTGNYNQFENDFYSEFTKSRLNLRISDITRRFCLLFRNVVKAIDTRQLHTVLIEWMKDAVESISGVVAVDGKQARRTKDAKKRALHVVSAFSTECGWY